MCISDGLRKRIEEGGREEGTMERDVLYDFGSDGFAGAAPGRETVEDDELVFGDGAVEVGFTACERRMC